MKPNYAFLMRSTEKPVQSQWLLFLNLTPFSNDEKTFPDYVESEKQTRFRIWRAKYSIQ